MCSEERWSFELVKSRRLQPAAVLQKARPVDNFLCDAWLCSIASPVYRLPYYTLTLSSTIIKTTEGDKIFPRFVACAGLAAKREWICLLTQEYFCPNLTLSSSTKF